MRIANIKELAALGTKAAKIVRNGQEMEITLHPVMARDYDEARRCLDQPSPPWVERDNGVKELDYGDRKYQAAMNLYQLKLAFVMVAFSLGEGFLGSGTLQERVDRMMAAFTEAELGHLAEEVAKGFRGPTEEELQEARDALAPLESTDGAER